jgi:hypothetical protein
LRVPVMEIMLLSNVNFAKLSTCVLRVFRKL